MNRPAQPSFSATNTLNLLFSFTDHYLTESAMTRLCVEFNVPQHLFRNSHGGSSVKRYLPG